MADNDKILVKIKGNPSVKVTDDQTIVREIKVGTPIKRVQPFGNDYNNLLNRPNVLDSDDVLALVDAQDLANIVDSGSGVTILGAVTVSGHIIPSADLQYDLGSPTNRFRSLYVGGQTLYIGSLALSEDSNGNVVISNTDENGQIILGTGQTVSTNIDSTQMRAIALPIIDSELSKLIDGAPDALNTLNELAAAINDDENFYLNLFETVAAQGEAITTKFNEEDFEASALALIDSDYINARVTAGSSLAAVNSDLTLTLNDQIIDVFDKSIYRTVKYVIQLEHDSDRKYHSAEILLTHNDSAVFITEYALVHTDSELGEFNASIDSNDISLTVTPSYTNTSIKAKRISIDA